MEKLFAVEKYWDQIKQKKNQSDGADRLIFFETEQEAREFVVMRASDELRRAEDQVYLAKKRLKKCIKKFGAA